MNVSMSNYYYPVRRETVTQNRKWARAKWIGVMVRYAHRGNTHWRRQRECVINSMKGEKKRVEMAKKSRRMLHFNPVMLLQDVTSARGHFPHTVSSVQIHRENPGARPIE